ncbi:Ig-like domain-containing protein [Clostridium sp. JS66]|uniref:Ig-like domain-containing protein n=1 Tax=Clostridium sp. JS66 TaxID=3064705 RepID=UPI00298DC782|nr:Ig-like domain-containing protein [Clostridium sp. JS66]WPC40187.1 Ig-like domain-containing protein [Clostridium sp. JS66]
MKNSYKILSFILVCNLILPTCAYAKEFENHENVAKNKLWTIKFNSVLDTQLLEKNINITDAKGNIVETTISISSDKKSVKLIPKKEYITGETYTLHINEGIKSVEGKSLKENATKEFTVTGDEKVNENLNFPIKAENIDFVTLADNNFTQIISNGWEPPKRDDARINEVVSMINTSTKIMESTEDEVKSIGFKKFIPLTLAMKNTKSYIHIWPLIKEINTTNTLQGKETIKVPFTDRYIMAVDNNGDINGNLKYYTVYSKVLPEYLLQQINEPSYIENYFTITKTVSNGGTAESQNILEDNVKIKNGDNLIFSGIGCSNGDIDVYITDQTGNERYHILNISSFLGEWSIEKTISNKMKTCDGKDFTLDKKAYYLEMDCTNGYKFGGQIIDLR